MLRFKDKKKCLKSTFDLEKDFKSSIEKLKSYWKDKWQTQLTGSYVVQEECTDNLNTLLVMKKDKTQYLTHNCQVLST